MIKLLRIDERLIHGQVATKWSKISGVDRIIVANDKMAGNPILKRSLQMAAPNGIKTVIKSVKESIDLCCDSRSEILSILLVVDCPNDAYKILQACKNQIKQINFGNYGRIAQQHGEKRTRYANNLYLDSDEKEMILNICNYGIDTAYQTIPEDAKQDLIKMLT